MNYGIASWAHELLGPGWVDADGKGETVKLQPIDSARLAQRALAEVYEQIERVARAGRERCTGGEMYSSAPLTDEQLITRREAVATLRMLGDALDYARVHLDYLRNPREARTAERPTSFGVGDKVTVIEDEHSWPGEITGFMPGHDGLEVMVRDENGAVYPVDARDIRSLRTDSTPRVPEPDFPAETAAEVERPF